MKKIIWLSLMLLSLPAMAAQEFRITDAQGDAAIIPKGATAASPAKANVVLLPGDRLVTGSNGRIEVASKEGTVLEVKEKSYVKLQKQTAEKTTFFVRVGRFLGNFAKAERTRFTYSVRSPVITAAIRGTQLGLVVDETGETHGGVVEGTVGFFKPRPTGKMRMKWADEDILAETDPEDLDDEEPVVSSETVTVPGVVDSTATVVTRDEIPVTASEGIEAAPNSWPRKLDKIPAIVVPSLDWFTSVKDRVPKLRDQWKDLDVPSKMKMRQDALRERVSWQVPESYLKALPKPSPKKVLPSRKEIPKPR